MLKMMITKTTLLAPTTPLSRLLRFSEEFEVALTEVSYSNSWYNLRKDGKIIVYHGDQEVPVNKQISRIGFVSAGRYESREQLIEEINKKIVELIPRHTPKLILHRGSHLVTWNPELKIAKTVIIFDDELRGLLGDEVTQSEARHQDTKNFNVDCNKSVNPLNVRSVKCLEAIKVLTHRHIPKLPKYGDIDGGLTSFNVYTDIIQHGLVGDTQAPLLKVVHVPSESKYREQVCQAYDNPEFKPLLNNEFSSIRIWICDDAGEIVPFKFGRTRLTLLFRPKYVDRSNR